MIFRGGCAAALMALLAGCVGELQTAAPWDPEGTRAALGVPEGDPWCGHMRALRASLDGVGPAPTKEERDEALATVRAEAESAHGGDPLWPLRKALVCEYTDGAREEQAEFDWITAAEFLADARLAVSTAAPESGLGPLVPVFDHLFGGTPDSLEPVDLSNPAFCDSLATSELALSQLRGPVIEAVGFPGSQLRAPDWFAMVQVSYQRWAREQLEGHQIDPGDVDFGGIPFHCRRFFAAYEGSKAFAIKDNLIFLLPERDDPTKAGRLEVRDALGNLIVLDEVLEAAQVNADGTDGEKVDFYVADLNASPALTNVVQRANDLPPPAVFQIRFGYNQRSPVEDDPQMQLLREELARRSPAEPLRIVMAGHADCVGPRWYNQMISEDRVKALFAEVIRPALLAQGFPPETLDDPKKLKLLGLGEELPARKRDGARCEADDQERRVVVVIQ